MLRFLKVTGHSLEPQYREGDFVLVAKIPFLFSIRPGDLIVFQHERYGVMIKQVARVELSPKRLFVLGWHERSVDSRRFGPIAYDSVIGKVVWHISRPR